MAAVRGRCIILHQGKIEPGLVLNSSKSSHFIQTAVTCKRQQPAALKATASSESITFKLRSHLATATRVRMHTDTLQCQQCCSERGRCGLNRTHHWITWITCMLLKEPLNLFFNSLLAAGNIIDIDWSTSTKRSVYEYCDSTMSWSLTFLLEPCCLSTSGETLRKRCNGSHCIYCIQWTPLNFIVHPAVAHITQEVDLETTNCCSVAHSLMSITRADSGVLDTKFELTLMHAQAHATDEQGPRKSGRAPGHLVGHGCQAAARRSLNLVKICGQHQECCQARCACMPLALALTPSFTRRPSRFHSR